MAYKDDRSFGASGAGNALTAIQGSNRNTFDFDALVDNVTKLKKLRDESEDLDRQAADLDAITYYRTGGRVVKDPKTGKLGFQLPQADPMTGQAPLPPIAQGQAAYGAALGAAQAGQQVDPTTGQPVLPQTGALPTDPADSGADPIQTAMAILKNSGLPPMQQKALLPGIVKRVSELSNLSEKKDIETEATLKQDALMRFQKIDEVLPIADQFMENLDAVPVGTGVGGRMQGLATSMGSALQMDPVASATIARANASRPLLAKAMGDVGNLTEQEQTVAQDLIPQVKDAEDTRAMKMVGLYAMMSRKTSDLATKAKVDKDPYYVAKGELLKVKSKQMLARALAKGVNGARLKKFLGQDYKQLGIPEFKTEADFIASGEALAEIGGRLAFNDEDPE